jgi:hypothetical protein
MNERCALCSVGMISVRAAFVFRHAALSLALCSAVAACADDGAEPSSEPSACEQVNAKRRSCGLEKFACETEYEKCFAECLVGWGCAEQEQPDIDPGITACSWACSPRFTCDDGTEIYGAFRCDGEGDCADSEDEADCPKLPDAGSTTKPTVPAVPPPYEPPIDGSVDVVTGSDDSTLADSAVDSAVDAAVDAAVDDGATASDPASGDVATVVDSADAAPDAAADGKSTISSAG